MKLLNAHTLRKVNMKNILVGGLALVLILFLGGCGDNNKGNPTTPEQATPTDPIDPKVSTGIPSAKLVGKWLGRCSLGTSAYVQIVIQMNSDGSFSAIGGQFSDSSYAEEAIQSYLESLDEKGKPLPNPIASKKFSGKIPLRIDPELHRELAVRAHVGGESLNKFIEKKLKKTI